MRNWNLTLFSGQVLIQDYNRVEARDLVLIEIDANLFTYVMVDSMLSGNLVVIR